MEAPAPAARADFPDWLSPMLVKELRQGVRTRVFVTLFILLQVAMLLTVSLTLLVAAHGVDTSTGTGFFWVFVGLPVLVVLPLNGLGAINGEARANTLELIFLTRLTAFRIVVGKWLASFVQSLLCICAVLPYLVLRYFVGGINLAAELEGLGWMLVGSAVLSACATGLSAYPVRTVRAVAVLAVVLLFVALNVGGEIFFGRGVVSGPGLGPAGIVGLFLCGGIVLVLMLEVGAARIAPPAENHAAAMRLLAAGGFLVALAVSFLSRGSVVVTAIAFVIAVLVCLVGLCDEPRWVPRLFRPFALRRWPGRLAGRFLYPGWYTAVPFTLLMFAGFGWLLVREKILDSYPHGLWFVALLGSLLLPVALVRFFLPGTKRAAVFFGVTQLLSLLAAVLALVCDNALGTALKTPVSFVPLAALIVSIGNGDDAEIRFYAAASTTAASLLLLAIAILRAWRRARQAENESLQPAVAPPAASRHAPLA